MDRREFLVTGAASAALFTAGRVDELGHRLGLLAPSAAPSALELPEFKPSVHGWPFYNFGDYGNCGGMCWSALDRFINRHPIDRAITAPNWKLRDQISRRQWDTLNDWLTAKVAEWTLKPDQGHWYREHSIAHSTREEWPKVRKSLADGVPINLLLIRVEGAADPSKNHQVLAYRYSVSGSLVTIWVYDPNRRDNDDVRVSFKLTGASLDGSQTHTSARMRGFFAVPYDRSLNVHTHQMTSDGRVGRRVDHRSWTSGWTSVAFFGSGMTTKHLVLLKQGNGKLHVHAMSPDGVVGPRTDTRDWTAGWTTAATYLAGGRDYLFLLKKAGNADDGKNVHIHRLESDGKLSGKLHAYDWSEGWTQAVPYRMGPETYLFLLKEGNGVIHVHRINPDGSVGARIDDKNWTGGWTSVAFYETGGRTYLFMLKASGQADSGRNVHVHRMNDDGTIGPRVHTYGWSEGWTSVAPFVVGGRPYLFLLKRDNGLVHIHQLTSSGAVGTRVGDYNWSSGWSSVRMFQQGSGVYLFLLKDSQAGNDGWFPDIPLV